MTFATPQFDLTEEDLDERTHVIAVRGEIHVTTAPEFSRRLNEAIARGKTSVVLDLSQVEFIDSTGLSVLLNGLRRVTRAAGPPGARLREPDGAAAVRDHEARHDVRHPRGRATRRSRPCARTAARRRRPPTPSRQRRQHGRRAERRRAPPAARREPSSCWPFSSSAMIVRPTGDGRAVERVERPRACRPPGRKRMSSRRAWKSVVFEQSRSARGSGPGRAATPRSRTSCAAARRGRSTAMFTTR